MAHALTPCVPMVNGPGWAAVRRALEQGRSPDEY
jgi:hypothetical protein